MGPLETVCQVEEKGTTRTFRIRLEPAGANAAAPAGRPTAPAAGGNGTVPVFSPFKGKVELVEVRAKVGDTVREGQVVAAVEAMKAKHDVRAPRAGTVASIDADIGADIVAGKPIMTLRV
jgi:biotin carboxyl carrier protein